MTNRVHEGKEVLVSIQNLKKYFPIKKKSVFQRTQEFVHANENVTVDIYKGETLGLVGESGCGKSTLGRTIVQLYDQTDGSTLYFGNSIAEIAPKYVKEVIQSLPKQVPLFFKEEEELHELEANPELKSEVELTRAQAQEKVTLKKRSMNNKYNNIKRIFGGLITAPDLTVVSKTFNDYYKNLIEIAQLTVKSEEVNTALTDPKNATKADALKSKLTAFDAQIKKLQESADEGQKKIDDLRAQYIQNDRFDEFEKERTEGIDLSKLTTEEMRRLRRDLQFIFQDPYSSLNPRMTVGQIIGEGVVAHGMFKSRRSEGYTEYIQDIMEQCGLQSYFIHRYPHQFSGGQRQRIGIARALALRPKFIVADEAVSALDVSIQSQIINLLQDLKEEFNLTYLFITHDLSVVKYISDRVAVMYLGHIVELTDSGQIFSEPLHPYTQALLEAIPRTDVDGKAYELQILEGDIPSAVRPPKGCKFNTRCKYAFETCFSVEPELKEVKPGHHVACHLVEQQVSTHGTIS